MPYLEREGRFRAQVTKFNLQASASSQSVGLKCQFNVVGEWHPVTKAWTPMNGLSTTTGTIWFIGKDGNRIERGIDTLLHSLNWDQDVDSLDGKTAWRPADCQIVVGSEEYKGKLRYKAQWINPWEGDGQPQQRGQENKATPAVIANIKAIMGKANQGGSTNEPVPF